MKRLNVIEFTVPLTPISKKNSQQIMRNQTTGKPFIMPSKKYKEYEKAAAKYIPKNLFINEPLNIQCLFYMPTHRRCDLTNMLEAIDDIMVRVGLLADDNFNVIQSHDGSRVLYDKEHPRTKVVITFLNRIDGYNAGPIFFDEAKDSDFTALYSSNNLAKL